MELFSAADLPPFTAGTYGDSAYRLGDVARPNARALSADGATMWSYRYPYLVGISLAEGRVRRRVELPKTELFDGVWRAGDEALVLLSRKGARWHDPERDQELGVVECAHGTVLHAAASPEDPGRVAVLAGDGAFLHSLKEQRVVSLAGGVAARDGGGAGIFFTEDGREVLLVTGNYVLRYDGRTGEPRGQLWEKDAGFGPARCARLVGSALVLLSYQGGLLSVDVATGEVRSKVHLPPRAWGYARLAGPTPKGRLVAAGKGAVTLFDGASLAVEKVLEAELDVHEGDLLVDRGRELAWVLDARGALHRADLEKGELALRLSAGMPCGLLWNGEEELLLARFHSPVERIDLRTGHSRFVDVGAEGSTVLFSDDGEAALAHDYTGARWVELATGKAGERFAIHPHVATRGRRCWSVQKNVLRGEGLAVDLGKVSQVNALGVSPSQTRALLAARSELLWVDLVEGKVLARHRSSGVEAVHYFSEEEALLLGGKGALWIDPATGEPRVRAKTYAGRGAVSADGAVVALCVPLEDAVLFTRDRPEVKVSFRAAYQPLVMAFSPTGSLLAVAGCEGVVRVFDVAAALATRPSSVEKKPRKSKKA